MLIKILIVNVKWMYARKIHLIQAVYELICVKHRYAYINTVCSIFKILVYIGLRNFGVILVPDGRSNTSKYTDINGLRVIQRQDCPDKLLLRL